MVKYGGMFIVEKKNKVWCADWIKQGESPAPINVKSKLLLGLSIWSFLKLKKGIIYKSAVTTKDSQHGVLKVDSIVPSW